MIDKDRLNEFDKLPLECDGLTKVISYYLTSENIKHWVHTGELSGVNGTLYHQWIELSNGRYIDYRARMWQGETAPHGIFKPTSLLNVKYTSTYREVVTISKMIFEILTN